VSVAQKGYYSPSALLLISTNLGAHMLYYTVVFFVIALIAAAFGFGGIAASAVGIAQLIFFAFAFLTIASFVLGLLKKS
jgi:uncharacterized membrane protein YtjA (UPF0391 family)